MTKRADMVLVSWVADWLGHNVPSAITLSRMVDQTDKAHEVEAHQTVTEAVYSCGLLSINPAGTHCQDGHTEHRESCLCCRAMTVTCGWCPENIVTALSTLDGQTVIDFVTLVVRVDMGIIAKCTLPPF
jgi:hypothetical protein